MSEEEWLDNHKNEIENINNIVEDLEKNKEVQKLVETFSRWQDTTIKKIAKKEKILDILIIALAVLNTLMLWVGLLIMAFCKVFQ